MLRMSVAFQKKSNKFWFYAILLKYYPITKFNLSNQFAKTIIGAKQCKPCTKKCENKCPHSKCQKTCSEPCKPCNEKCQYSCAHMSCSKLCHEVCNRKPCNMPCLKKIKKCGHPCIGLCGKTQIIQIISFLTNNFNSYKSFSLFRGNNW